ncbi:MAG: sigma-70 family RNA polymerase sigma factor [Deltaproteobacteria bacterium]|nr:sigma-70 family RNA polymerase sigma factor [Deltaproteobacteria bacterium]
MSDERAELEARIRAACTAGNWSDAATLGLATYGPELLGYLVAMTRDETAASDAFSIFSEHLWKGLPKFRWECSFRTWAYGLARHALGRWRRDPHRRRATPLSDTAAEAIAADVRSQTATFLRTETEDKVAAIRAQLDPDDQTLLILRLNRQLQWRDIARILADDEELEDAEASRRAASLRKRFERLKEVLRERVNAAG